jgi:hypothetical protein
MNCVSYGAASSLPLVAETNKVTRPAEPIQPAARRHQGMRDYRI